MSRELPPGWVEAAVEDVTENLDRLRIPVSGSERSKRPGAYPYFGANGQVGTIDEYLFDGDYVLVAEDGGYFDQPERGVAYLASGRFWVNNHAHVLQPLEGIDLIFLKHALNDVDWSPHVGGTTRQKLTQASLNKVRLGVPPLPEQRRIVERIEALLAKGARAEAALAAIPDLLDRYRRSLLAAAFRGDLTAEFTEEAEEPFWVPRQDRPETLPRRWGWTTLSGLSSVTGGLTKNPKRHALPLVRPYLRVANVYADDLRLEDVQEIRLAPTEVGRVTLEDGDLLIVEGNGSLEQIGRVAMWTGGIPGCVHQNHLIKARPHERWTSDYMLLWLLSPMGRLLIEAEAASSAGLHTLSISKISRLPVPVVPRQEAAALVARVRGGLRVIASLEAAVTTARARHLDLSRSVLAKAFRGDLVPQDPSDEPASVLLERIRSERAATGAAPRRGRRRSA